MEGQIKQDKPEGNNSQAGTEDKAQNQKQDQDDGMPDLNDPGVQKSSLMIQQAFLKKKATQKARQVEQQPNETKEHQQTDPKEQQQQPTVEEQKVENTNEPKPGTGSDNNDSKDKSEKDEELPDLQDPGVQKTTMMMQKAFFKKKQQQKDDTQENTGK